MKVYVAASSDELDRARYWMTMLSNIGAGVTSEWAEIIAEVGTANPRDAATERRFKWSANDLASVAESDMVWFLVPKESAGRGAYYETGFARAAGIPVISSGDTKQSIFNAQGKEFATDDEAFAYLHGIIESVNDWLDA